MTTEQLRNQAKVQLAVIQIIAEAAKTAGSLGAPAGPIYAALMEWLPQINPDYFDDCVGYLVQAKLVTYSNSLITWVA